MAYPLELGSLLKLAVDALYLSIVIDETGMIRYVGSKYAEILGIDPDTVIGVRVDEIIPNTRLLKVLKTGKEEVGQLFIMKNGETTICNRFPIKDKQGYIRGVLSTATFQDLDKVQILHEEVEKLKKENKLYKKQLTQLKNTEFSMESVIGSAPEIMRIKDTIVKVSDSNIPVLFTGETGTGKEVFANAVHMKSNRRFENYIKINCAAIPKDLLESELFGYAEGAFSGASKGGKIGKIEYANRGTILLDEIGEMPLALQAKLLRVLQEKEIEPVGSTKTVKLDVRFICSTNQNIEQLVQNGQFRQDLYYRINTVELNIPPLRERLSDIPSLCDMFIQRMNQYHGCSISGISKDVLDLFYQYSWPGNIRELEHVLERACVMTPRGLLETEHFDFFIPRIYKENLNNTSVPHEVNARTLSSRRIEAEKAAIEQALVQAGGNKSKAARLLKITRSQLYAKLNKYGSFKSD